MGYFRVRSWHIVGTHTRAIGGEKALCGLYRIVTDPANLADDLPWGAKSCETCLRINRRHQDAG